MSEFDTAIRGHVEDLVRYDLKDALPSFISDYPKNLLLLKYLDEIFDPYLAIDYIAHLFPSNDIQTIGKVYEVSINNEKHILEVTFTYSLKFPDMYTAFVYRDNGDCIYPQITSWSLKETLIGLSTFWEEYLRRDGKDPNISTNLQDRKQKITKLCEDFLAGKIEIEQLIRNFNNL